MQLHVFKKEDTLTDAAAAIFAACILENPACVLGLATGSTPVRIYGRLAELCRAEMLDFSRVRTYNLDEYVGLDRGHEQSYYTFMWNNLFSHINIPAEHVHVPAGAAADLEQECRAYEQAIAQDGGIDLQLLGIGRNGHIAFNEPDDAFSQATHVVELTPDTIDANKRFFDRAEDVPRRALSTGIGTILRARRILLVATGANKAEALRDMLRGPVTPRCPASALQLHPAVTVLADRDAASLL